jgi:hypothetical protein
MMRFADLLKRNKKDGVSLETLSEAMSQLARIGQSLVVLLGSSLGGWHVPGDPFRGYESGGQDRSVFSSTFNFWPRRMACPWRPFQRL